MGPASHILAFTDRTSGHLPVQAQMLMLGALFVTLALILDSTWAFAAGTDPIDGQYSESSQSGHLQRTGYPGMAERERSALALSLFSGVVVLLAGLAGCDSGGTKAPAATTTHAESAATSSSPRGWQQALGNDVTVTMPATPAPGLGSPGAAVIGQDKATLLAGCAYNEPSFQAECRTLVKEHPNPSPQTMTGIRLGYVAVDGNLALVGVTATICQPGQHPECISNRDPAAIFSTAKTFTALWTEAVGSVNSPVLSYALTPCIRVNGRWYVYYPTAQPVNP